MKSNKLIDVMSDESKDGTRKTLMRHSVELTAVPLLARFVLVNGGVVNGGSSKNLKI